MGMTKRFGQVSNQLKNMQNAASWTEIIEPRTSLWKLNLRELWEYRDLLWMWVKRDFAATYKQTALGPLWFFIQPLLTTIMFVIVFGRFAKLSTDGLPQILFYLSGITIWNYFAESLTRTATVFKDNANIFGKVYFPRLVIPVSIVVSNLAKFAIQFLLFAALLVYYWAKGVITPGWQVALLPVLLMLMAGFALGAGMLISAMTTRYRDLIFLLTFGVQLFMYATPVIYPLSSLDEKYRSIAALNPLSPVVETFRYAFLGSGTFSFASLGYSAICMLVLLVVGVLVFNKVEKTFMDTV
jgi:lipopolysaccharide transport system permease protein